MSNQNRPSGLRPVGNVRGTQYNGAARLYSIAAANTNAFAIGDPVITDGAVGADSRGVPAITLGAITGPLRGVVVGLFDTYPGIAKVDDLNRITRPSGAKSTTWYALVADDPDTLFEVQEVGTGTLLTLADVGLNVNLVSGADNGFVSGWQLGNTTEAVTATLQCRIFGPVQRQDNFIGLPFQKWLVTINNHELAGGTAGL
jgi:hypothetical protein